MPVLPRRSTARGMPTALGGYGNERYRAVSMAPSSCSQSGPFKPKGGEAWFESWFHCCLP